MVTGKKTQRTSGDDTTAAVAPAKHQRVDDDAPASSPSLLLASHGGSATQVFTVELLTQKIFASLDASSVMSFATFLRSRDAWRPVLSDEKLWDELVTKHFGGRVSVAVPPQQPVLYSDEEEDDEEDPDDDNNGDDDGSVNSANSGRNANRNASQSTTTEVVNPEPTPPPIATLDLPVPPFACQSLVHFARSARQRQRFADAVYVISGDIGTISRIEGHVIDGIAFATSGYLHNPHTGAAAAVFRRAGPDLDSHVNEISMQIDDGEVYVTPGFDAGVERLIHCAGPTYWGGRGIPLLAQTYENVMQAAVRENLNCIAMTSISTGNLGFPVNEAAPTAMQAIKRFIREHSWPGTIGIVCYEMPVFDAFTREKQRILDNFNVV